MSATEELRRLLDERGVKYGTDDEDGCEFTEWEGDGYNWIADSRGGLVFLSPDRLITPAQAVEATLGREPDDAAMVKLHDQMNAALLEYERAQGIERRDGDGRTVIPFVAEMHRLLEEAALRGHEECRMDKICDGYLYFTSYWCRKCDGRFAYRLIGDKHATPKCCPICGAKVVTE